MILMPHRSWKRKEQLRLFHAYFGKCPHYSSKVFEVFSISMSPSLLLKPFRKSVETEWSADEKKLSFASYHMQVLLEKPEYAAREDDIHDPRSSTRQRVAELKSFSP